MNFENFERAKQYALARLEHELPGNLTYHNLSHTRDDVLPAAEKLAASEGVTGEQLLLLLTAVVFHDLGFVEDRVEHEALSARIAREVLPGFGFTAEEVEIICGIIIATRIPQSPHTHLEEIMADADLDVLSREDFLPRNQDLRTEMAAYGQVFSDEEWYSSQLHFLQEHQFYTPAGRTLCNAGKAHNQALLAELLGSTYQGGETGPFAFPANETAQPTIRDDEKVSLLRAVRLFAETPEDTLFEIARLLKTARFMAGEVVFNQGDIGDCMYFIVQGRVKVHDGDLILNYLGMADVFGEMALLDAERRVATVTAEEDTLLLRLDQAPFYDLMMQRVEVSVGLVRVLSRHLRGRVRDMVQDFEYMQQMARITATAAALEAGRYDPRSLDEVGQRTDELGQLARVFQRMADEVQAREKRLKLEVQELRIQVDEAKKALEVAEITQSEFFQALQAKARKLRGKTE